MKLFVVIVANCAIVGSVGSAYAADTGVSGGSAPHFAVNDRIPGPDGGWDYATIDERTHRLFLGRDAGVLSLDLKTKQITPVFVPGAGVHGAFPVGDSGLVLSTNGDKGTVTVFEGATGKVVGELPVGKGPDGAAYEPKTGLVAVMTHRGSAVLVDVRQRKVAGTVAVGGELEFPAAAGDGRVFVNVANKHEIAVIDVPAKKLTTHFTLEGCVEPSGLAYDAADEWLISVCANGVTKFVRAADGGEIATLKTGSGSDGVLLDAARRLVFVPAGHDGTLTIIGLRAGKPTVVQTLPTHKGARLGALDTATGRVYLPSAQLGPPVPPDPWPSVKAGTFEFLVVGSQ
jgi:DNA-binding beta-propeller fold protein YncE